MRFPADIPPPSDYADPRGEEWKLIPPWAIRRYVQALRDVLELKTKRDETFFVAVWAGLDSKERAALKLILK